MPTALETQRETAGIRYAAAVVELKAAMVDLAGIDIALSNRLVSVTASDVRSFPEVPTGFPNILRHPNYVNPWGGPGNNWMDLAKARGAELVKAATGA